MSIQNTSDGRKRMEQRNIFNDSNWGFCKMKKVPY